MKGKILLVFLYFGVTLTGLAQQFAFEYWHEGKIILDSGDTLKGSVKYDMQTDLLQYQLENNHQSFSARNAIFFEIFDTTTKQYRQFYSLPYSVSGGYKTPVFFELLTEGKLTLLSREALEYRTYTNSFYYYGNNTRLILVYKYFMLQENGDIAEYTGKKNDWLDFMGNQAKEVEKYAKANKLAFDNKYELVKIVTFYNSLFK